MSILKKLKEDLKRLTNFLVGTKPLKLKNEVKKIDVKGLEKKTKAELEKLGRKIGIELDKRLTKPKLISQIKKQNKKL
mgnify:CR=1 FL=1|tara:strand:- start:261 stop:494 length:234 start_codon:yes stop_codon:yes gene_type:complete